MKLKAIAAEIQQALGEEAVLALAPAANNFSAEGEDVEVSDVFRDSRAVRAGGLYAAMVGEQFDGTRFAEDALSRGACAIMAERARPSAIDAPWLQVRDVRRAMAIAAQAVAGHPSRALDVVGITGTNGKTTTAYLTMQILEHAGKEIALLGTVAARLGEAVIPSSFTTPEADDLARFCRHARESGVDALVMEVSSHGLALFRTLGMHFHVAAFSNLSQDHLDFHGTMDAYGEAKAMLFLAHAPDHCVINVDSEFGAQLADRVAREGRAVLRVHIDRAAKPSDPNALCARDLEFHEGGLRGTLAYRGRSVALKSPLVGAHNVENLLLAIGIALSLGVDLSTCAEAIASAGGAPGRLERVPHPAVNVLVDYAHTPEALERVLLAVREVTRGAVICVFGCGGDRDQKKRPKMGEAVARHAEIAIVTNDNPRSEPPEDIAAAITQGLTRAGAREAESAPTEGEFVVRLDRRAAIGLALSLAKPGDSVLIAGKGHETTQTIGAQQLRFDDREVAREWIERAGSAHT